MVCGFIVKIVRNSDKFAKLASFLNLETKAPRLIWVYGENLATGDEKSTNPSILVIWPRLYQKQRIIAPGQLLPAKPIDQPRQIHRPHHSRVGDCPTQLVQ